MVHQEMLLWGTIFNENWATEPQIVKDRRRLRLHTTLIHKMELWCSLNNFGPVIVFFFSLFFIYPVFLWWLLIYLKHSFISPTCTESHHPVPLPGKPESDIWILAHSWKAENNDTRIYCSKPNGYWALYWQYHFSILSFCLVWQNTFIKWKYWSRYKLEKGSEPELFIAVIFTVNFTQLALSVTVLS